ncbi:hypothetical protein Tco_1529502, partial [Tanacetum coccineum]
GMENGKVVYGGSGSKVKSASKEFNVTESDFSSLNKVNSLDREKCSNMELREEGVNEEDCMNADINDGSCELEHETNTQMDQDSINKDGMNPNMNKHNSSYNSTIAEDIGHFKSTPINKTFANMVKPDDDNGDNKLCQIPIVVEEGREVVIF